MKAIFIALLFLSTSAQAESNCDENLLNSYFAERSAMLASDFSVSAALKTFDPGLPSKIKEGEIDGYLIALRLVEAKILNLYEYSAKCTSEGGELYIKIHQKDVQYDRLGVVIKKYGGKYLVYSYTFYESTPEMDGKHSFKPLNLHPSKSE